MSVDFPAALGPTTAVTWPASSVMSTPSSTRSRPNCFLRPDTTSGAFIS